MEVGYETGQSLYWLEEAHSSPGRVVVESRAGVLSYKSVLETLLFSPTCIDGTGQRDEEARHGEKCVSGHCVSDLPISSQVPRDERSLSPKLGDPNRDTG